MKSMIAKSARALCPAPVKALVKSVVSKYSLGDYQFRVSINAVDRPHYAHIMINAAQLAAKLGYPRVSVIEYGVAGGQGLLSLERHAAEIEKLLPIKIEIYGFDTGRGLPSPKDFRDLPYHWKEGFFRMDEAALVRKLTRAKLVLGPIEETAKTFFDLYKPAPIGAVVHDFDFYSSTAEGLRMLTAGEEHYLPRVFCYFDDTIGDEIALYSDFTGQRLAIHEFNNQNESIKLSPAYYTLRKFPETWHKQLWISHFFLHEHYNAFVSAENQQLSLGPG